MNRGNFCKTFLTFKHLLSIFYEMWMKQSGAMVFIFNLDKVLLKKLFPTMNILKVRIFNIENRKCTNVRKRPCTGLWK